MKKTTAPCKRCGTALKNRREIERHICSRCVQKYHLPTIPYPDDEDEREAAGCCGSVPVCGACPFWERI